VRNYLDRFITGFFIFVFGIIWFFRIKEHVKPKMYDIISYDVFGNETNPGEIRTKFRTHDVALSYIREYQKVFPHLKFSIQYQIPEIKRSFMCSRILKIDHK